jgi:hypothetical protein
MSLQRMDADTAETVAGVIRLLRRAAELVWAAADAEGAGSPRQLLALGIDLAADDAHNLLPDAITVDGPVPVGDERLLCSGRPSGCCGASPPQDSGPGWMACEHGRLTSCGRRTPVPALDRRTVGELLTDSDALARETLLDSSPDQAPAMVMPSAPTGPSGLDPMERLRAVGEAIGRSVTARHWPGQGPADERLTQIADNLSRARNLVDGSGRPQQSTTSTMQVGSEDAYRHVVHLLYVAAHGTTVALSGYVTDLQRRLEVGARRRQPLAERPTALEITEAQGMIAPV